MNLPINEQLFKKLDEFCITKKIPNILFHGSSGCGKKTIVLDFVSRIYNNNTKNIKENVLFINCSQGKGIKFIREELKTFAKYNIHVSHDIPFKSIIMLNFDNLSIDAQSVMRRIIELFINTRFFIIVENKYKLLNPIISRFCSIYIPEHIINAQFINLHQYQLMKQTQQIQKTDDTNNQYILKILTNIIEKYYENNLSLMDECNILYEKGISCIDLINIIEQSVIINEMKKSEILMRFYILKKEYRCEKLLMFHIFSLL
jgi:DNA polymerase III delta prime subunit